MSDAGCSNSHGFQLVYNTKPIIYGNSSGLPISVQSLPLCVWECVRVSMLSYKSPLVMACPWPYSWPCNPYLSTPNLVMKNIF